MITYNDIYEPAKRHLLVSFVNFLEALNGGIFNSLRGYHNADSGGLK